MSPRSCVLCLCQKTEAHRPVARWIAASGFATLARAAAARAVGYRETQAQGGRSPPARKRVRRVGRSEVGDGRRVEQGNQHRRRRRRGGGASSRRRGRSGSIVDRLGSTLFDWRRVRRVRGDRFTRRHGGRNRVGGATRCRHVGRRRHILFGKRFKTRKCGAAHRLACVFRRPR